MCFFIRLWEWKLLMSDQENQEENWKIEPWRESWDVQSTKFPFTGVYMSRNWYLLSTICMISTLRKKRKKLLEWLIWKWNDINGRGTTEKQSLVVLQLANQWIGLTYASIAAKKIATHNTYSRLGFSTVLVATSILQKTKKPCNLTKLSHTNKVTKKVWGTNIKSDTANKPK